MAERASGIWLAAIQVLIRTALSNLHLLRSEVVGVGGFIGGVGKYSR